MKVKKDGAREGDARSIRLEIVCNANGGSGGSGGSGGLTYRHSMFEPQRPEPIYPTPRRPRDGDFRAPEKKLTLFALRLAVLEKAASGLGTLGFIWATVVLLGGFAIKLSATDFWYVTIILLSEGTRIFSRSHELEWQHHATRTLTGAGRYSFRAIKSSSRFIVRTVKAVFDRASVVRLEGDHERRIAYEEGHQRAAEFEKQLVRYGTQRTWHPPDVPLLPHPDWVFVSKNISRALTWLQIASAVSCVTLSLIRLVQQDYGENSPDTENRKPALELFYSLALAEALMFLAEKIYWTWRISYCGLLQQVSTECELGEAGIASVRRFFYDAYSQCIEGSIFDGIKMDLATFAVELLDSEFPDEQLIGARILQQFAKSESFASVTLRKIGTSTRAIERLIEMLNWKNPEEEKIRQCAAEVVLKLAGRRQNALRVAGIPGAMESIASLLYTGPRRAAGTGRTEEAGTAGESTDAAATGESNYEYVVFNLLGLLILKKLANDHDNCGKIGNARGLLATIIEFTSATQGLLLNEQALESQIRAVKRALQVVKMLVISTGNTGKLLRREISEIVFTVSNIREILQYGDRHIVLQKLAIEILKGLAMDETAKERIASTGGIVKLLLDIFFKPEFAYENSVSAEAGEALAMLTLESKKNCVLILKKNDVLERLIGALGNPVLQLNASRILRNLCTYSGHESADRLNQITAAMPIVLKATMKEKEKLLEVSVGLTTQICKFMSSEQFVAELERADIKEIDYVENLIKILKKYKYPEIKVPRIRRFVILQTIWMMQSHEKYLKLFKDLEMEKLLESVADTTSDLECFHVFSGSVGLSQHRKTVSSIVDNALVLLSGGASQEDKH